MPQFSEKSKRILATCHPKLIAVCNTAIMKFDFSVISGHRVEQEQNTAFRLGNSHLTFPHSKHNKEPSMAVDLAPYPVDFDNISRFILLGGYLLGISEALQIKIRWGGCWANNFQMEGQRLADYGHIELFS